MQAKFVNGIVNVLENEDVVDMWHKRLSHMSEKCMIVLAKENLLSELKSVQLKKCGKQREFHASHSPLRKSKPLDLIYFDLCGPMKTRTLVLSFSSGRYLFQPKPKTI